MSVKRIYYVKKAQQRFARGEVTGTVEVKRKDGTPKLGRGGKPMTRRVISKDHSKPLPNYKCGKCGDEIQVGAPYLYWEPYFRSSMKSIRCMKASCSPRPSERDSSLMSSVLAAQESVEASLSEATQESASDFEELAQEMADALEEVIDQYKEADEHFGGQGSSEAGQKAEELESSKDEIESLSFDAPPERDELDVCDGYLSDNADHHPEDADGDVPETNIEGCPGCDAILEEKMDTWREEQATNLQEAMSF